MRSGSCAIRHASRNRPVTQPSKNWSLSERTGSFFDHLRLGECHPVGRAALPPPTRRVNRPAKPEGPAAINHLNGRFLNRPYEKNNVGNGHRPFRSRGLKCRTASGECVPSCLVTVGATLVSPGQFKELPTGPTIAMANQKDWPPSTASLRGAKRRGNLLRKCSKSHHRTRRFPRPTASE